MKNLKQLIFNIDSCYGQFINITTDSSNFSKSFLSILKDALSKEHVIYENIPNRKFLEIGEKSVIFNKVGSHTNIDEDSKNIKTNTILIYLEDIKDINSNDMLNVKYSMLRRTYLCIIIKDRSINILKSRYFDNGFVEDSFYKDINIKLRKYKINKIESI